MSSYLYAASVEHEVCGTPLRFYAISPACAAKLRTVAKPLSSALVSVFQGGRDSDQARHSKYIPDPENPDAAITDIEVSAVSVELAAFRTKNVSTALDTLMEALLSETTGLILVEVIMDSLRDEFPRDKRGPEEVKKVYMNTDIMWLSQAVAGVAKANQGVFGPFVKEWGSLIKDVTAKAREQLQERMGSTPESVAE